MVMFHSQVEIRLNHSYLSLQFQGPKAISAWITTFFSTKKNWIGCLSSSHWKPSSHFLARKQKKSENVQQSSRHQVSSTTYHSYDLHTTYAMPTSSRRRVVASSSSVHCGLSKSLETSAGLWTTKPGSSSIHHRIMGFPLGFPWDFHGISIGILPWDFTMGFPLGFYHGILPWDFSMGFPWDFHWDFTMGFYHGISIGILPWDFTMGFYHGIFPWDFTMGFYHGQLLGEYGRFSQNSLGTWEPWKQLWTRHLGKKKKKLRKNIHQLSKMWRNSAFQHLVQLISTGHISSLKVMAAMAGWPHLRRASTHVQRPKLWGQQCPAIQKTLPADMMIMSCDIYIWYMYIYIFITMVAMILLLLSLMIVTIIVVTSGIVTVFDITMTINILLVWLSLLLLLLLLLIITIFIMIIIVIVVVTIDCCHY